MPQALTLKTRFILFLALLGVCALLALLSVRHLLDVTAQLRAAESARHQTSRMASEYKALAAAMTRDTMAFVSTEQPEFEQRYRQHLAALAGQSSDPHGEQTDWPDRFRDAGLTAPELARMQDAHAALLALSLTQLEAIGTAKGELDDGQGGVRIALPNALLAKALIHNQQYTEADTAIAAAIDAFDAMQSVRLERAVATATARGQLAGRVALGALAGLLVFSALALHSLYRSIKRPLDQGVAVAGELSQGNLAVQIPAGGQDEMGRLMQALEGIRRGLGETVNGIAEHARHIESSAATLSDSQESLLRGGHSQAAMLRQTATAMTELDSTVQLHHERTAEALDLSARGDQSAREGRRAVERLAEAMTGIQRDAQAVAQATRLIGDIAFQTNLLALNAAVEAAHAGHQGRGFAVVASEVRILAQRCTEAAKAIAAAIDKALANSREGSELAVSARSAMSQIVDAMARNRQIMDEVSVASQSQADAIRETAQATRRLEDLTARNASEVENTAQAVFEQHRRIDGLRVALAQFRLESDAPANEPSQCSVPTAPPASARRAGHRWTPGPQAA